MSSPVLIRPFQIPILQKIKIHFIHILSMREYVVRGKYFSRLLKLFRPNLKTLPKDTVVS